MIRMVDRRDRPVRAWRPTRLRPIRSRSASAISAAPASSRHCRWSQQPADNDGIAGARLAIEDNNTTGKFLNQHFTLDEVRLKEGDDPAKAAMALAERNGFIIADLPADALLKAADALRDRGTVLFNAGAIDDRLREAGLPRQCDPCRADPLDARRRAGAISGLEAMEALAAGDRLARQ